MRCQCGRSCKGGCQGMSRRKSDLIPVIAVVAALVVVAIAWVVVTRTTAVAIVNGQRITRRAFVSRLEQATGEQVLSDLINEQLIRQAAKQAKVTVTQPEVEAEIDKLREQVGPSFDSMLAQYGMTVDDLRKNMDLNLLVFKISTKDITVGDDALMAFFEENKSDYDQPEMVKASHILVESEEKAKEIQTKLAEGADFAELARDESSDPMSAAEGGDLGFFARGRMVPEFEKAAFAMSAGQTSGIVKSEYGYHIIRVTDRKDAHEATFEEVRGDIERTIKGRQAKSAQELASELRLEGDITITDSKYKDLGTTTPFGAN
ncbi:MAG TPA: foldase [Firmicutes bacterium]|nr:foldase [Bacillota bacterium]